MTNKSKAVKESKRLSFRYLSIGQKLPLLVCSLILAVTLTFGLISYLGVRKSAFQVGQERLQSHSQQLASMLSGSTQNLVSTAYKQANVPAFKAFLSSNGNDSLTPSQTSLQEFQNKNNYQQVEIRNAQKKSTAENIQERID